MSHDYSNIAREILEYQASRGTVRRAIEQLQERGFAQKIHGKGTFVLSPNPIEFQLGGIVSFYETHADLGDDVRTEVVELTQFPLEGSLLQHIEAEPGTLITRIKRVRRIGGKRVILDINHFVAEVIPGLDQAIAEQSIYAFIEQTLQLQIAYAQRTMDLLGKPALLQLLDSTAHSASAGLVAVHQFSFGGKARAALQTFSGDAGKQIRIDLVVFAHGDGSVPDLVKVNCAFKAGTLVGRLGFVH
jgi:hypothetical protein